MEATDVITLVGSVVAGMAGVLYPLVRWVLNTLTKELRDVGRKVERGSAVGRVNNTTTAALVEAIASLDAGVRGVDINAGDESLAAREFRRLRKAIERFTEQVRLDRINDEQKGR